MFTSDGGPWLKCRINGGPWYQKVVLQRFHFACAFRPVPFVQTKTKTKVRSLLSAVRLPNVSIPTIDSLRGDLQSITAAITQ